MARQKLSEWMLDWLRDYGRKLSPTATIKRTRSGRHQKSAGAWVWYVSDYPNVTDIGGCETLTELRHCPNLGLIRSGIGIDVEVCCDCKGICEGLRKADGDR